MGLENIKVVVKNVLDTCLRRHIQGTLLSRSYSQSVVMTMEKGWLYNIEYCYRERYTSYKN